ncbi:hypothetical protein SBA5_140046 [Candidatus Sulfotelmatomonas gaucii]|uniref:Uncharacterized protein n=1 Tax=Candidatus Sulfuritelmatomonas gaucii TaxID=2043161 RepID=A0A2N9L4M5_9BACT|nr:hypothetical protein SBA5_140046 [Candidatus Sulfotelmatomonas gaucii]
MDAKRILIKQIFPPAVVAAAEHAYDLAAGVQREGARLTQQDHVVNFAEQTIALLAVALMAAGHKIFPGGAAAARTRHDVIEGELAGRVGFAAVLAGVAIAQEDVFARESARLVGDAAVLEETDDRGHGNDGALRVQREAVFLLSARDAFEHEHQGAPRAADINRLIGGVKHQHRHLQDVRVRMLHGPVFGHHHGLGDCLLLAGVNHGFSQRHLFPHSERCLISQRR